MSPHLHPFVACGIIAVSVAVAVSVHSPADAAWHQTPTVHAHSVPESGESSGSGHSSSRQESGGEDPSRQEACSDRHTRLQRVMGNRLHRARAYVDLLATVTARVKDFHASRTSDTGQMYRATVKDIKASHRRATASTEAMAAAMQRFDCGDDKIEPVLRSYTTQLDTLTDTLGTYRDTVIGLIDRVKNGSGATSNNRGTERR